MIDFNRREPEGESIDTVCEEVGIETDRQEIERRRKERIARYIALGLGGLSGFGLSLATKDPETLESTVYILTGGFAVLNYLLTGVCQIIQNPTIRLHYRNRERT